MRVGFLFNRYFPYQVPHAAPYAFELSRRYPDIEVIVACSTRHEMELVETIGALYPGHRCKFQILMLSMIYKKIDPIVSRWKFMPKRRVILLAQNLNFF